MITGADRKPVVAPEITLDSDEEESDPLNTAEEEGEGEMMQFEEPSDDPLGGMEEGGGEEVGDYRVTHQDGEKTLVALVLTVLSAGVRLLPWQDGVTYRI